MIDRGRQSRLPWAAIVLAGAVSVAGGLPSPAIAQAAGAQSAASLQSALENKTRLVKLLLSQSPALLRIPQSNNAQAKKKLADVEALYAKASTEAGAGRPAAAVKLLDEALREIAAAARLVPDPAQQAAQERTRYTSLVESTRTFVSLYQNLSSRMAARKVAIPAGSFDFERVGGMLAKAEGLAAGGDHKNANAVLGDAYKAVVGALSRMLMAETIVYDLKFESPADEFKHELARNRSYEELLPLALAQMNTPRETATLAERYGQQSKELRDVAQKQAAAGDFQAALKVIQDATGQLQRALRVAGVIVPQSLESKP